MIETPGIILFALIFLVVYSYAVYPAVLAILGFFFSREVAATESEPVVTLIISARDEEKVIAKKIENSLNLDYPKHKLEIMVVSDDSTDLTDEIVKNFEKNDVILLSNLPRRGKTPGLNEAVPIAKGEVIVFSDADSIYEPNVIKNMVRTLGDPGVGLVTGSTRYMSGAGIADTSGFYTRLEKRIKLLESSLGSCVGADGAIFAMRKSLYEPLRDDDINDLVIPLEVVKKGYRVVFREDIICSEPASGDTGMEFKRQARITNRTLRAIFRRVALMNPFRFPLFGFQIISHKLIRLSVPFFMLVLFPLNLVLLGDGTMYEALFTGQCAFYFVALAGFFKERSGGKGGATILIYHFVMVNASILLGWIKFLSGDKQVTWGR